MLPSSVSPGASVREPPTMFQHQLTTHLGKDEDTHRSKNNSNSNNNRSDSTLTTANPTYIPPRQNSQSISPLNTLPNSPHNNSVSPGTSIPQGDTTRNDEEEEDGESMIFERNVEDPYFLNNHTQQASQSNSTRTSRAPSIHRIPTSVSIQSDISNASSTNSTMMFPPMERHHTLENYVPPILDEMGSLVTDDDTNLEDISMIYDSRRPSSTLGLDMALGRRTRSYSNIDPNTNSPQSPSVHNNNNNNNNKLLRLYSYADILYNDNPRPNLKPHHFSYSGASSPTIPLLQQQQQQHTPQHSHQNMFIQPGSPPNAIQETNLKNPFMLRHSETSTSYPASSISSTTNPLLRKNSHPLPFKNHSNSNNINNINNSNHKHSNNRFHIESSEEGSTDDEDNII